MLAAHRDDHPQHPSVRRWFDAMLSGEATFTVPLPVWGSFLRLATSRQIFAVPTPRADAFAFIAAVCSQPLHIVTTPGPRHLALLRDLSDEADASGDLIADVVIAALAAEHGAQVVTLDRDFARFSSIAHGRPCV